MVSVVGTSLSERAGELATEAGKVKSGKAFRWTQIASFGEKNGCFDLFHGLSRGSGSLEFKNWKFASGVSGDGKMSHSLLGIPSIEVRTEDDGQTEAGFSCMGVWTGTIVGCNRDPSANHQPGFFCPGLSVCPGHICPNLWDCFCWPLGFQDIICYL